MLPAIQTVPQSREDWDRFAFAHAQSHLNIIQAIRKAGGPSLTEYVLYPMDPADMAGWLQRNQQAHIEMDAVVGSTSADLQDVDLTKPDQLEPWVQAHWFEHYMVESALKIAS